MSQFVIPVSSQSIDLTHESAETLVRVRSILDELVPGFVESSDDDITIRELQGGITNRILLVSTTRGNKTIIRVFGIGTEAFLDRTSENLIFSKFSSMNIGPKLLGIFTNGRIEGFIEGRNIEILEMSDAVISPLIAKNLALFHCQIVDGLDKSCFVFAILQKMHDAISKIEFSADSQEIIGRYNIEIELNWFRGLLAQNIEDASRRRDLRQERSYELCGREFGLDLVLCHNDLLPGNIMWNSSASCIAAITFIDYEYAGLNCRAFDFANHFIEYAGNDNNFSLCPDAPGRRAFITEYLRAFCDIQSRDVSLGSLEFFGLSLDQQNEFLLGFDSSVQLLSLAALLMWGIWGFVQFGSSNIEFDFMKYATARLDRYQHLKSFVA